MNVSSAVAASAASAACIPGAVGTAGINRCFFTGYYTSPSHTKCEGHTLDALIPGACRPLWLAFYFARSGAHDAAAMEYHEGGDHGSREAHQRADHLLAALGRGKVVSA